MDTPDFRLSVWRGARRKDIYSFNQPLTFNSQTHPLQTIRKTQHPMPYTATPRDTEGGCYGGNSLPQSEVIPRSYAPELDHANAPPPPHCLPVSILRYIEFCLECDDTIFEAVLSVHSSSYAPQWNAPPLHSSIHDQHYGAPVAYVNDVVCGYGVWSETQQSAPFAPGKAMASISSS